MIIRQPCRRGRGVRCITNCMPQSTSTRTVGTRILHFLLTSTHLPCMLSLLSNLNPQSLGKEREREREREGGKDSAGAKSRKNKRKCRQQEKQHRENKSRGSLAWPNNFHSIPECFLKYTGNTHGSWWPHSFYSRMKREIRLYFWYDSIDGSLTPRITSIELG